MIPFRFLILISFFYLFSWQNTFAQTQRDSRFVAKGINALNEVMMYDITSPPVVSRNFVYAIIAFYEAVLPSNNQYKTYAGKLTGLQSLPKISPNTDYDFLLAGMTAFYKTSIEFVFSKEQFEQLWKPIEIDLAKRNISKKKAERSIRFGEEIAKHIIKWAKEDGFTKTRAMPRFTTGKKEGFWQQTGPDYMEAVEPFWNTIRPMVLLKANEFLLPAPVSYTSKQFMEECKEVYQMGKDLTKAQSEIANFWDCNPYATQTVGHLVYSVKKISPAGHWMGITGIIIQQKNENLIGALHSYSLVCIAIFDAIIAAWDEKYRSNYIRPITAIQKLISPEWQPLLQTPPFPEYPSGHSVISFAAAIVLSNIYGNNVAYVDDVEKPFGLPARRYNNFMEAANEAAISRLCGGIHFRESIENGAKMGEYVGIKIIENLIGKQFENKRKGFVSK